MTDLDDRLRAMLHERAADIDTVPARVMPVLDDATASNATITPLVRPDRRVRRTGWLVAAAAACVVALTAGVIAIGTGRDSDTSPAGPTPTTDRSTSVAPPTSPAAPRSSVALSWFRVDNVASYEVLSRSSEPGYRSLDWRRSGELGSTGGNGGLDASASVTVFEPGKFPAARSGVLDGVRSVDSVGTVTYRAEARRVTSGRLNTVRVPTIAWQYATDAWAVVQARTSSPSNAELAILAHAVHPGVAVAITLPFRLATPPPGTITSIVDGRPEYPLIIRFDAGPTRVTEFQIKSKADRVIDFLGMTRRKVGGLTGYIDPANGGYVEYADGIVTISKTAGTDQLDIAGINKLFDGFTWSGGDGSGEPIPVRSAFPR